MFIESSLFVLYSVFLWWFAGRKIKEKCDEILLFRDKDLRENYQLKVIGTQLFIAKWLIVFLVGCLILAMSRLV